LDFLGWGFQGLKRIGGLEKNRKEIAGSGQERAARPTVLPPASSWARFAGMVDPLGSRALIIMLVILNDGVKSRKGRQPSASYGILF
jgi:hypothetical protein